MKKQVSLSKIPGTLTHSIGMAFIWRDAGPMPVTKYTSAEKLLEDYKNGPLNTNVSFYLNKKRSEDYYNKSKDLSLKDLKQYIVNTFNNGKMKMGFIEAKE